jgi:DsbC/DsbD-like thiol-disulfide interchange protein
MKRVKIITMARAGQGRFRATIQERREDGWETVWRCPHMTPGYSGHQTRETATRCAERQMTTGDWRRAR